MTVLRPSGNPPRAQVVRLVVGCAIAAVALVVVLRGTDLHQLWLALRTLQAEWLAIALGSIAMSLAASAMRWRLTFFPDHARIGWGPLFSALLIGQMLNIVLPLRTGEIGRAYVLSASRRIPVGKVLSTIAIERLSDLAAAGTVALLLIAAGAGPDWLAGPGRALVAGGMLAVGTAVVLTVAAPRIARFITRVGSAIAPRFRPRLEAAVQPAVEGLAGLRNVPVALSIWMLAMVVTALAASTNYFLFRAFEFPLAPVAALVLLVALQIGNSLVSVPGNLGVFHAITVLVLTRFGVEREPAIAYSLVLYAVAIVPKILLGAACLSMTKRHR
jgi:glycosyltransferase 2 family protein